MKERGIIMTAWSVVAIRARRKTQTRRLIKPQPHHSVRLAEHVALNGWAWCFGELERKVPFLCPWGVPGDLPWVRETYTVVPLDMMARDHEVRYKADDGTKVLRGGWGSGPEIHIDFASEAEDYPCEKYGVWRSPRFMFKWAARTWMEITDVRVQQVQDISEADAIAEGIEGDPESGWKNYLWHGEPRIPQKLIAGWDWQWSTYCEPIGSFSSLWELIHGPGAWERNDWVWAISFELVEKETAA